MADNAGQDALSGAATGAVLGSAVPGIGTAVGAVAGGVIGLAPSLFKLFSGASQKKQANAINPVNPGYQVNQNIIDNANILKNRYLNYTLPGYGQAQDNINRGYQYAFSKGVQGASSGGDVADLAAKLAYGKNVAQNQLEAQNAQGKEGALMPYIDASAAAGQQYQQKNAYDIDQYNQQLKQKAALTQAGNTNEYNALDSGASVLSSYLNPKSISATTDLSASTKNSKAKSLGSIFSDGGFSTTDGGVSPYSSLNNRYSTMYGPNN